MQAIAITAHRRAEVIQIPDEKSALGPLQVRGRTQVSLVSSGTELNAFYLAREGFPGFPGYASVFEVTEVGAEVGDLAPGTLVLASGGHREIQEVDREGVVELPPRLAPEKAVFARLLGVSMSTLNTTRARPPCRVLVTGLGPVGNLAAQIFQRCGYEVTAVDPVPSRCELARSTGLADVRASLSDGISDLVDKVRLHVECSGHEQAILDGARIVGKGGEVVLVGVPWQRRTDLPAFDLAHAIFHRYVTVRSGWEWEIPRQPVDFGGNSMRENYAAAMRWIAAGEIKLDGMATAYPPSQADVVYRGLLDQSLPAPSALFDWRQI